LQICAIQRWWSLLQRESTHGTDANDNKFLECALEARADYVVTGNVRHFPSRFQDIRIVLPKQFLTTLAAEPQ